MRLHVIVRFTCHRINMSLFTNNLKASLCFSSLILKNWFYSFSNCRSVRLIAEIWELGDVKRSHTSRQTVRWWKTRKTWYKLLLFCHNIKYTWLNKLIISGKTPGSICASSGLCGCGGNDPAAHQRSSGSNSKAKSWFVETWHCLFPAETSLMRNHIMLNPTVLISRGWSTI